MFDNPTYVYANIRVPIKISSTDIIHVMSESMEIEFEPCDGEPEQVNTDHRDLMMALFSVNKNPDSVSTNENNSLLQEIMRVTDKDYETKTPRSRQNTSFKQYRKYKANKYTRKQY